MLIHKNYRSPHFANQQIPVEFVILHYTAQSFSESLKIFLNEHSSPLSCHLLITEWGKIYELVDCWEASCKKAFHAGKSFFLDSKGRRWENFNNFSLGIELVNWNGNVFPFTKWQYESLFFALSHLKNTYTALQDPERILGHEHIAGFRGKADPGFMFDWPKMFENVYPQQNPLKRTSVWTKKQCQSLAFLKNFKKWNDKKAKKISQLMERPWPWWLKKILFRLLYFLP